MTIDNTIYCSSLSVGVNGNNISSNSQFSKEYLFLILLFVVAKSSMTPQRI